MYCFVRQGHKLTITILLFENKKAKYFIVEASGDMPLIGLDSKEGDSMTSMYYSDMWDNDFALSIDGVVSVISLFSLSSEIIMLL